MSHTGDQPGPPVTEKENAELLAMLAQSRDWRPDVLEAARAELQHRGFEFYPDATTEAAMEHEFDELRHAVDYKILRNHLRNRSIASIIWGLVAIALGVTQMDADRINIVVAVIGVFLVIEGIWILVKLVPAALIVDGVALLILGIWNIPVTVMNNGHPIFFFLGVAQIVWGCQSFLKYRRYAGMSNVAPSTAVVERSTKLLDHLKNARMVSDPAVIEFLTSDPALTWKGELHKWGAVFAVVDGHKRTRKPEEAWQDLIFVGKQDVSVVRGDDGLAPNTLKMILTIKRRKRNGLMSQGGFERFESWKVGLRTRPTSTHENRTALVR